MTGLGWDGGGVGPRDPGTGGAGCRPHWAKWICGAAGVDTGQHWRLWVGVCFRAGRTRSSSTTGRKWRLGERSEASVLGERDSQENVLDMEAIELAQRVARHKPRPALPLEATLGRFLWFLSFFFFLEAIQAPEAMMENAGLSMELLDSWNLNPLELLGVIFP